MNYVLLFCVNDSRINIVIQIVRNQISENSTPSTYRLCIKGCKQMQELVEHFIKLIESDDERYSFEWAVNNKMEIYDKEKSEAYKVTIEKYK